MKARSLSSMLRSLRRCERLMTSVSTEDLPLGARWLHDNARAIYSAALGLKGAEKTLRKREYARLLGFCRDFCAHHCGSVHREDVLHALKEAQSDAPFTVRELRRLCDMLRYASLERLCGLLPEVEAELAAWQKQGSDAKDDALSLYRAMERLSQSGDIAALRSLEGKLRQQELSPQEIAHQARARLERTASAVGAAVGEILQLPRLDYDRICEKVGLASQMLMNDATFARMDRPSRELYLDAVSDISRCARCSEEKVCAAVLSLRRDKAGALGEAGYYLLEDRTELYRALNASKRVLKKGDKIALYALFLACLAGVSLLISFLLLPAWAAVPLAFSLFEGANVLLSRGLSRVIRPGRLPRLRRDALPKGTRALVVIPAVVPNAKQAMRLCRHLDTVYRANAHAPLDFMLLGDFVPAAQQAMPEDEAVLSAEAAGIEALRRTHGGRFYLLHRERERDAEGIYSGFERKRGALEMLNTLLCGEETAAKFAAAILPEEGLGGRYQAVITLDADTFLPCGAAEKLLGALLHPLQRGRKAVIQPRMASLPMHVRTRAQRVLGGMGGADGYGAAASERYQDLFGRGSFMGKGIYAPQAFLESTRGLPVNRILSHDLLEGELAGAALASDIVCYDGHPNTVQGFFRREHRWIRGDWQLLPFLAGKRLDLLAKIKIADNLRRALNAPMRLLGLIFCAYLGALWPFLLLILGDPITLLLLPMKAQTALDAILRALWRQFVSHRKMLEWTTAAQSDAGEGGALRAWLPPLLTGAAMLFAAAVTAFLPGFLLGAMWMLGPLAVLYLNGERKKTAISPADERFLIVTARETLRFFSENVGKDTQYLPPDNVQTSPKKPKDMRLSPTNAGLYLLSLCAAREMRLLSGEDMLLHISRAVDSLGKLPCWHGIPYNWYDLHTLSPLPPKFVSSVDAGNYLLCLLCAAQGVRQELRDSHDETHALLPARIDALCRRMELHRLYDKQRELFYIGYDASRGQPSDNHYDLMASEALMLSYAAIVMGEVGEKHWWHLGRTFTRAPGPVLLSWSGTMFEYLMSALLLPVPEGTLLYQTWRGAVRAQKRAGRGDIFGISESASPEMDAELRCRYHAFGVQALALDANSKGGVYAPYAAALALKCDPKAACCALKAMKARRWSNDMGFFDAAVLQHGGDRVAKTQMAHHQGMLLCAICNVLYDDYLPRLLRALPCALAHLPLLNELPPRRVTALPKPLRTLRGKAEERLLNMRAQREDAILLSGGGHTLLLTGAGNAHYYTRDIALTRFDATEEISGPQLYAWTNGAPARLSGGEYVFKDGSARCAQSMENVRARVSLCVDADTGAALYRVRLRNVGGEATQAHCALYLEPSLAPEREDKAHIAFSNLFFSFEKRNDRACLVRRRDRKQAAERQLYLQILGGEHVDFCCDRAFVIGREGGLHAPQGLTGAWDSDSTIEMCLAARVQLTLHAGQEETLTFALLDAEVTFDDQAVARAFSHAALRALSLRRSLRLSEGDAATACRLLGALSSGREAVLPARIHDLWALGVSGDMPYLLVSAREEGDTGALGRIARLFAYLLLGGANAEMIWLLPEENAYEQPLRAFCEGWALRGEMGGRLKLFFGLDEAAAQPLRALCALHVLSWEELEGQFAPAKEKAAVFPASGGEEMPLPRLNAWNGFGGFLPEGGYLIAQTPPAPWSHILCAGRLGTLVCDSGILYSYIDNSRLRRLTQGTQDSVAPRPAEVYSVIENGRAWSLTPRPFAAAPIQTRFEMGAASYTQKARGLQLRLTAAAEGTLGVREISIHNQSDAVRALTVKAEVRFALGEDGRGTAVTGGGDTLLARGALPGAAFFILRGGKAEKNALVREVVLKPQEHIGIDCFLGYIEGETLPALPTARAVERAARAYWQERLHRMQFFLPDEQLSGYLNTFLPYQVRASRLMMRAGFYQAGGAFGFRDQLQDMLSLLYTEPERVREHLLLCASRQYVEGDVQHWWHPEGAGVRTRISDDLLFLPYVTARYVLVTGDQGILHAHAPYLQSAALNEDEHDRYEFAETTAQTGTLYEHCLRAIYHVRLGPKGIPLMQGGDWNDGMDRVGGESAWLGFFYIMVLRDFAPLCEKEVRDDLAARRIRLQSGMQAAWTGRWFLRAWYEDGRSLGAPDSEAPRIDLISQCFAAFAGMPRDQVKTALDSAWDYLHDEKQGITLLLKPPFAPEEKAGYIGAYAPGVRENGGQYTHAVPWFMRALIMVGEIDRAWQLLYEILPYMHSLDEASARHYRTEPYALPADIYITGRGGWTWYTGSASWLYDVFLTDFLGFEKRGEHVRFAPRVPETWEECTLLYRYGSSRYHLTASRSAPYATLDGEKAKEGWIALYDDGKVHEARFPL